MILDSERYSIRTWGMVGVSALAVILMAAVSDADRNWTRIRELPPEQRSKLLLNLRKFDLEVPPEKQAAIRELDRRIAELDPEEQRRYFSLLRRYHNWLNSLPENRQDELLGQSPEERILTIHKLVGDHPVPTGETPLLLQIAEVGELSPFELASAFRIWQTLSASERTRLERMPQERGRRKELFKLGKTMKSPIPRETMPEDYDEEKWIGMVEGTRPSALLGEIGKKRFDEAKKKFENLRKEIVRRQAINLYLSRTAAVQSVQPERLAKFIAGLPSWAQTAIEQYPPDVARRRVTFAYRLVFPPPKEIGEERPSSTIAKGQLGKNAKQSGSAPAKGKASPTPRLNPSF